MRNSRMVAAGLAIVAVASPALAHTGQSSVFAWQDGLLHPLQGLDHLLAAVAVGFWAAQLGGRARIALPSAFVTAMSMGAFAAMAGTTAVWAELAILASLVMLGTAISLQVRIPAMLALTLCSLFAFAHGQAHGHEAPPNHAIASYVTGLAVATAMLHAAGVVGGRSVLGSPIVSRAFGAAIVAAGLAIAVA